MSTPFLGEVKLIAWNFPPKGWAFANGQFLSISQNQALFSLFGTTYGGDGRVNFALPDLRSRIPVSFGSGLTLGERAGQESHTVILTEMPQHIHFMMASQNDASTNVPDNTLVLAGSAPNDLYTGFANPTPVYSGEVSSVGGSQPHENRQPYLAVNMIVALQGIFPSQT